MVTTLRPSSGAQAEHPAPLRKKAVLRIVIRCPHPDIGIGRAQLFHNHPAAQNAVEQLQIADSQLVFRLLTQVKAPSGIFYYSTLFSP